jgi:hypothetical protein
MPRRGPRGAFRRAQRERDVFRAELFFAAERFRVDFFAVDLRVDDLRAEDFRAVDFLADDFFAVDFFAVDFFAAERLRVDFFAPVRLLGTFAPFSRASERPIAIACLRLETLPPWPALPRFSVPLLRRRIALSTDLPAALPYFRPPDFFAAMSPP